MTADAPLVSCLCVTEDRAAFMPWLLWGYDRQSYTRRELVIVDSSTPPLALERPDVRVISAPYGTNVPTKRNIAMAAARGDFFAWFDDDDWQHPDRLKLLVSRVGPEPELIGGRRSWFLDLHQSGCALFEHPDQCVLFNSALFPRNVRDVVFREDKRVASDSDWLKDLRRRGIRERILKEPLFFWLSHDQNISNPSSRRKFDRPSTDVVAAVGEKAWGETDARLAELRTRLSVPRRAT